MTGEVSSRTKGQFTVYACELGELLKDSLVYPFRGTGWMMILMGAGLVLVFQVAAVAPVLGGIAGLLGWAYLMAFYFDVIATTVSGSDETPEWPVVSELRSDVLLPAAQIFCAWLLSLGPAFALNFLVSETWEHRVLLFWGLLGLGVFYFPMSLLNMVVCGELGAMLPHRVMPAIWRCLRFYLPVVVLVVVISGIAFGVDALAGKAPLLLGWALAAPAGLYLTLVQARMLGMVYRKHEAVLEGWVEEEG